MTRARPRLSVIMPVRNEGDHLEAAVAAVLAQRYPGELQLVLAVAPSTDATGSIAQRLAEGDPLITVVDNPSGTTPAALNRAIAVATGDVIARVDAHAELTPGYLEGAVAVLEETGAANVGGIQRAVGTTPMQRAIAAAMSSRFGTGDARFHYGGEPGPIDALFEPPWTTCHVGTIAGGTADNITAKDCHFVMGFRCIPSESVESWQARYLEAVAEVEAMMRAVHPEARIDTTVRFQVPGLQPERDGAAEALARRITGDNATNAVSYATEAGQFQEAGYSAVIIGPGNIAQAHQPNEWLSIAEFEAGIAFVDRIIAHLCEDA